jgi:valyl-tRNA synthetase
MNLDGFERSAPPPASGAAGLAARWIRSRYARVVRTVTEHYEAYEFDRAARVLYEFIWGEYCDWFLEMAKVDLPERREAVQHTLWAVLSGTMQLLHPIMPFLTEEVWQQLPHDGDSIMLSRWPSTPDEWVDEDAERAMETVMAAVRAVRSLRAELALPPTQRLPVQFHAETDAATDAAVRAGGAYLAWLARTDEPASAAGAYRPTGSVTLVLSGLELSVGLAGLVDAQRERVRIGRALEEVDADATRVRARLADEAFVRRAPADVVERDKARVADLAARHARLREILDALG